MKRNDETADRNESGRLIHDFLSSDHRRLEALFEQASADPGAIDRPLYERFRRGLFEHIAMEEKILVPAVREVHGETPSLARRIRLDHAAITALLAPPPSATIVTAVSTLLSHHDDLEEREGSSKHGSIYVTHGDDSDWTTPLPEAEWDAPTCAYCGSSFAGCHAT